MTEMETARKLAAVILLKARVTEADQALRAELGGLQGSLKITVPDPAKPNKVLQVALVNMPAGSTVAAVADRDAFTDWAAEHYPDEVIEQPRKRSSTLVTQHVAEALEQAVGAWRVVVDDASPFDLHGDTLLLATEAFLDVLGQVGGMLLAPVAWQDARREVSRKFEDSVLAMSKAETVPTGPKEGDVPAGIEVSTSTPSLRVTPTKDSTIAERFISSFSGPELVAIANFATTTSEDVTA